MPALDLAIGLSFIFLMLSLVCSAVQELISAMLAWRAKELEKGLRAMLLQDTSRPTGDEATLIDGLYANPLISGMQKTAWWPVGRKAGKRMPSYLSPRAFALTLLDTLAPPPTDVNQSHNVIEKAKETLSGSALPNEAKDQLRPLLIRAGTERDELLKAIEQWFDDSMARVSGWYKRKTQVALVVIAAVVTIAMNANTLTIGERLWKDPAVRTAVAAQATQANGQNAGATPKERLENAAANADGLKKLGVPLGWSGEAKPKDVLQTAGGWLLTIAALSLGAPFWFDALSRLSRLRGTGKPEQPLPASQSGNPRERA
jgi:hypothetical protein